MTASIGAASWQLPRGAERPRALEGGLQGEWIINKLPIVKHVYSASKQISGALNPSDNAPAFRYASVVGP